MSDEIEEDVEDMVEDEDLDEDFDEEPEADTVDDVDLDIDDFEADDVSVESELDDDDEEEEPPQPRARKVTDDEDDDEEQDPDDVEADLEAILRDRMAAADDDEEDEAEDATGPVKTETASSPRNDEFVCESCFLLVNRSQFGSAKDPRCPMGDTECPSIAKIFG